MTLNPQKRNNIFYFMLAFIIPVIGYLIICLAKWAEPFGNDSAFLLSDSYYQYYPFFTAFRRSLLSGDSLLYSWNVGMGMDYLGLISYYLASPLNWLVVLVPESLTLELYFILVPIRLGLASMFFAIFLNRTFGKNDMSITLFGCFYGTCAWALGYIWNVMWLDTFALLPLVALGTVALLRDKKFILYTVCLFLSVFTNYYIGFFTCIFVLLLFICYQICNFTTLRRFASDLGRIALFSALAIGMTAILELPALAALNTTVSMSPNGSAQVDQSIFDKIPKEFRLNIVDSQLYNGVNGAYTSMKDGLKAGDYAEAWSSFRVMHKAMWAGLLDGMRQVAGNMGGGLTHTVVNGLPNIYCGVGTIFLAALFLTGKGIKLREKLCCVGMLLFLILSFLLRPLDYIWHGFHFPNQIPYRFSFLYSFVMLYMAYKAYLQRHRFGPLQLLFASAVTCGLLYCSGSRNDQLFIVYNLSFFLLYVGVFCLGLLRNTPPKSGDREAQRNHLLAGMRQRRLISWAMWGVMVIEIAMNLANFGTKYTDYGMSSYPDGGEDAYSIVEIMKEIENRELFYRAEATHSQLYNDGAILNFNSTSTFSSSADVDTTEFLRSLGIGAQSAWNRYAYEVASPVTNLFLNLKYMIHRSYPAFPANSYFDNVYTCGNVELLENNAYLPLGFLAQPQLANTDISPTGDRFGLQNQLMMDASGITGNVWQKQYGNLDLSAHNVSFSSTNLNTGTCRFQNGQATPRCVTCGQTAASVSQACSACGGRVDQGIYVTYTYTAQQDGLFAVDMIGYSKENITEVSNFVILHNGIEVMRDRPDVLTQMLSVCDVVAGDTIQVKFTCNAGKSGRIVMQAAILNETLFRQAYDELSTSTLKLTTFENTRVEGTIQCHRSGLLYTSIPDNGNWVAYVDGKEAPIVVVGKAMVGLSLTEGVHTVTFVYRNRAFALGWKISLLCLIAFVALCVVYYKRPNVKGKYEK